MSEHSQVTGAGLGEALVEGMRNRDLEGLLALMDPGMVVIEPDSLPYGGRHEGHDGFVALLGEIMALADLQIGDTTIHAVDGGVIMELQISFTSHKDGEIFRTSAVEIDRVGDDGRVREIDVYYKDVAATNEFFARQRA